MLDLRPVPEDELPERRRQLLERMVVRRVRDSFEDADRAREHATGVLDKTTVRHFDVVDDARTVGELVWWHGLDASEVQDLLLDDPARSPELLPALVGLAHEDGSRSLGIATIAEEPARDALVALEGFERRATNMALPLDRALGDPGDLELRAMTQAEFDDYIEGSTEEYIGELAAAGMTPEAAREQGERQMAELVPNGLESPGQSFFTAWVEDTAVGTFWVSTEDPLAFVYDIAVREDQRRKGYGAAIMNAGALHCRALGHPALGLNVFGHNRGARALYDKLGYHVTRDYWSRDLTDAG